MLLLLCSSTHAAITTDGTLGPLETLSGPDYAIIATLGTRQGSNLFHSFHTFNLAAGESATFSGPPEVTRVISRVTGGEVSRLDGTLRVSIPTADGYFLNPAGVVFGPRAVLDVPGGFYLGSADYLRFEDGSTLHALTPELLLLLVNSCPPPPSSCVNTTPPHTDSFAVYQ